MNQRLRRNPMDISSQQKVWPVPSSSPEGNRSPAVHYLSQLHYSSKEHSVVVGKYAFQCDAASLLESGIQKSIVVCFVLAATRRDEPQYLVLVRPCSTDEVRAFNANTDPSSPHPITKHASRALRSLVQSFKVAWTSIYENPFPLRAQVVVYHGSTARAA